VNSLERLIIEIYRQGLIKFGEFKLSSGKISPYYIDLRTLPSYPQVYREIMTLMAKVIESTSRDLEVVAGIETSGIVHAAYLGCLMGKSVAYVRKKVKEHGLMKLVEGVVEGKKVAVVDDVSTTGTTLLYAIEALRDSGAVVEYAFVIVDRCEGAGEKLREVGVTLKPLITIYDILNTLERSGLADATSLSTIRKYLENK